MNQATIKWLSPKKINRMTALSYQRELTSCNLLVLHVRAYRSQTGVRHNSSVKMSHFPWNICSLLNTLQGSQIRQIWRILRQNCSDDSTEVTEGVTLTSEIFGNKQGATSTPGIFGNKHSFVPTFFATNAIYINFKHCKP